MRKISFQMAQLFYYITICNYFFRCKFIFWLTIGVEKHLYQQLQKILFSLKSGKRHFHVAPSFPVWFQELADTSSLSKYIRNYSNIKIINGIPIESVWAFWVTIGLWKGVYFVGLPVVLLFQGSSTISSK